MFTKDGFMKNILLATFLSLFAFGSLIAEDSSWTMGDQWFKQIQTEYQQGKYKNFISDIDAKYQKAEPQVKEQLQQIEQVLKTPEGKEQISQMKSKQVELQKEMDALSLETNKQISKITNANPNLLVSKIYKDSAIAHPIARLDDNSPLSNLSLLEMPLPDDEYKNNPYFKAKDLIIISGIKKSFLYRDESLKNDLDKYIVVLDLDKFQKLVSYGEANKDTALVGQVKTAEKDFATTTAERHNARYLIELGSGERQPANDAEKQIAEIMKNLRIQQQELLKKIMPQQ